MVMDAATIPQLNTTLTEPLHFLEQHFLSKSQAIEDWFQKQWAITIPPVYGSIDLRNAGFKLAPIDMNLFPAGFNNLNPDFLSLAVCAAKKIVTQLSPKIKKILVIPENHTRNIFYWENIKTLKKILEEAGFEIKLGLLKGDADTSSMMMLETGLQVELIMRQQDELCLTDFIPDIILLNNDLSEGIPDILQQLKQPIIPPAELGWSQRLKSEHFQYYAEVAAEFSKHIMIDPWLISPLFKHCGQVDFMEEGGLECLRSNATFLFSEIQKKYEEYHIPYQPFLVVKADAGTYGMAVMTIRHIDELSSLNRKQRKRMSMTKGNQPVNRVIIQEGVYTFETVGADKAVAEPVVYLLGSEVIGGFYRVHKDRGVDENLNSPGMQFEPIAFPLPCNKATEKADVAICQNRLYLYGVIAQLSMLAAAREMKDQLIK